MSLMFIARLSAITILIIAAFRRFFFHYADDTLLIRFAMLPIRHFRLYADYFLRHASFHFFISPYHFQYFDYHFESLMPRLLLSPRHYASYAITFCRFSLLRLSPFAFSPFQMPRHFQSWKPLRYATPLNRPLVSLRHDKIRHWYITPCLHYLLLHHDASHWLSAYLLIFASSFSLPPVSLPRFFEAWPRRCAITIFRWYTPFFSARLMLLFFASAIAFDMSLFVSFCFDFARYFRASVSLIVSMALLHATATAFRYAFFLPLSYDSSLCFHYIDYTLMRSFSFRHDYFIFWLRFTPLPRHHFRHACRRFRCH